MVWVFLERMYQRFCILSVTWRQWCFAKLAFGSIQFGRQNIMKMCIVFSVVTYGDYTGWVRFSLRLLFIDKWLKEKCFLDYCQKLNHPSFQIYDEILRSNLMCFKVGVALNLTAILWEPIFIKWYTWMNFKCTTDFYQPPHGQWVRSMWAHWFKQKRHCYL